MSFWLRTTAERDPAVVKVHGRGELLYRCKCGYSELLGVADFSFRQAKSISHGPDRGTKIRHMGAVEIDCAGCGAKGLVEIDIWEYPCGVIDAITVRCSNGELLVAKEDLRRFLALAP